MMTLVGSYIVSPRCLTHLRRGFNTVDEVRWSPSRCVEHELRALPVVHRHIGAIIKEDTETVCWCR